MGNGSRMWTRESDVSSSGAQYRDTGRPTSCFAWSTALKPSPTSAGDSCIAVVQRPFPGSLLRSSDFKPDAGGYGHWSSPADPSPQRRGTGVDLPFPVLRRVSTACTRPIRLTALGPGGVSLPRRRPRLAFAASPDQPRRHPVGPDFSTPNGRPRVPPSTRLAPAPYGCRRHDLVRRDDWPALFPYDRLHSLLSAGFQRRTQRPVTAMVLSASVGLFWAVAGPGRSPVASMARAAAAASNRASRNRMGVGSQG